MVGETGFEPATSCSQSRRATRLRHSPTRTAALVAFGAWYKRSERRHACDLRRCSPDADRASISRITAADAWPIAHSRSAHRSRGLPSRRILRSREERRWPNPDRTRIWAGKSVGSDHIATRGVRTRAWARQDSNPQPSRYERPALTIELQAPRAAPGAIASGAIRTQAR